MEKKDYFAYWLTGFTDGEGCFSVSFNKRDRLKLGIEVRPSFSIGQSGRTEALQHSKHIYIILYEIQAYFQNHGVTPYVRKQTECIHMMLTGNKVSDLHTHIIYSCLSIIV